MKRLCLLAGLAVITSGALAQYCTPGYTVGTTDNDYINGFQLGDINNTDSGPGDGSGYSDYTDQSTDLEAATEYSIFVENTPSFGEYYRIWLDYDHSGTFDSDEEIVSSFNLAAGASTTLTFTTSTAPVVGLTTLRIRCVYGGSDFDACSEETYGETEDYTVNLLGFDNDISITEIDPIGPDCNLGTDEAVTVHIKNYGVVPATGYSVSLRVDGIFVAEETPLGGIPAGLTYIFTFTAGADLSDDGEHTVEVWTQYDADENPGNDSLSITASNTITYMTTGFPENICYDGVTVFPSPVAGGGTWSGTGIIDPVTGELDPGLAGGIGGETDITYTFTTDAEYTVTEIPYAPVSFVDPTALAMGDDAYSFITPGFNFQFFGNTYTTMFVCSNGFIGFGAGNNSYTCQNFPNGGEPNNMIAMCWTDLNPNDGGSVKYEVQGVAPNRRLVVKWDEVPHYGHEQKVTGELVLYETSNIIDLHAINFESDGGTMTMGIENQDGTMAFVPDELYNQEVFSMEERSWRFAFTPCDASVTETIYFVAPPVISLDDVAVCAGNTVVLDPGPGAYQYVWNTGDFTQTLEVTETGDYSVIYYANETCFATADAHVDIWPVPEVDLGADGVVCEGTTLDAENPGDAYAWSTGQTTQTIFVTASDIYSVIVTDPETGCIAGDTVDLTITPLPVASFETIGLGGMTIAFSYTGTDAVTYLWDFGDGELSNESDPWHTYATDGDYTVTLVVTNDCGADIYSSVIQTGTGISDIPSPDIYVYPVPANDVVHITYSAATQATWQCALYNSIGEMVWENKQCTESDLSIDISGLAAGTYWVRVEDAMHAGSVPLIISK